MPDFKEDFLQFIWQHKLLLPLPTFTVLGKEISILKQGELNVNSGPDFFNAQIKMNELTLVGNIELHLKTSDWLKHGHTNDKTYNNIILHVVYEHDKELEQNKKFNVDVLELKPLIDKGSIDRYKQLFSTKQILACHKQLAQVNDLKFLGWLDRMLIERLEEKVIRLNKWFEYLKGDYTQTFYFALLRNFGFNVNADAFELLAKQLPLSILSKHSDNLVQLESLLLGTAGFLDVQFKDASILKLQNEFEFLKNKYRLIPLQKEIFKFSRMRPANFPNLRLAQFAALVHYSPDMFFNPNQFTDFSILSTRLNLTLNTYWKNHYKFDGKTLDKDIRIGKNAIENLIINTFAPFLFFYGQKNNQQDYTEKALFLLQNCAFETNKITQLFKAKQILLKDASQSQGILNLYHHYCKHKQCLKCGVAAQILKPT